MRVLVLDMCVLLCGVLLVSEQGVTEARFEPVTSGREALAKQGRLPWYDVEKDELRRIEVVPRGDDEGRLSRWARESRQDAESGGTLLGELFRAIMQVVAWIGLGLLAGLVIWGLIWAAVRSGPAAGDGEQTGKEDGPTKGRIEELPVSVSPANADLLEAARAYFRAGDLEQAIIHVFAYQLVELDKNHLIQLTKGKTNRQYLSELRARPRFIELLKPTMLAFEDVFFGHHKLVPARFQACWEDLERFHQQLKQVAL